MNLSSLPPMDVAGRADRLRAGFGSAGIDALLVSNLTNVRYLTGFTGSAALVLVRADGITFVTDGRYRDQSSAELGAAGVEATIEVSSNEQQQLLTAAVTDAGIGRLGLEAGSVTWADQRRYATEWFPGAELVPTEGMVEGLRLVKDAGEVARMQAAAAIADAALAETLPMLVEGRTEREIALALEVRMREGGATGPSFATIVAGGPNGAKPHARPGDRPIGRGELVVIDFGAVVDGYCSDMTRTFSVGEPSDPTAARMLEVVTAAQQAGVDRVAAGVEATDVDAACREVIAEAGWADAFLHGTGHGVGLDIHEDPRVSTRDTGTLRAGYVVTVEPGVYLPEVGGVRVEDTVVVTDDGCTALTRAPKEPVLA